MKHSALSMLLLFGIGLAPALGLLGGGNIYYGKGDSKTPQSAGDADGTGTKVNTTGGTTQQKTTDNQRIEWCAGDQGSTCKHDAKSAQ
jgi:hypothetical protein